MLPISNERELRHRPTRAGVPPRHGPRGAGRPANATPALGDDPCREEADATKLTGPSGLHRLRVGGYRVAHQINDGELVVLGVKAGDRRDVRRTL
ncbi:type II toxin-antitoxin system RelE/ParE family toxin [Streptomyces sp. NPDC051315]|uniref:type II toxin-antitoxin system RelE/ParE family toxin n=1 Tax=Streptomyces sp. NPDC051315 TaxID=3365650 RepID=UPI003790B45D